MLGFFFVSIRKSGRKTLISLTRIKDERLCNKAGFSLLEFTLALMIMTALVSILIPKLNDLQDDAHRASVQLTANSLQAAVNLTHSLWQSQGSNNRTVLLKSFGRGNILIGSEGWPIDAISLNADYAKAASTRSSRNSSTCIRLWNGLLKDSAPKVVKVAENINVAINVAYFAQFTKDICRYRYRLNQDELRIDYDLATGRVIPIF
jgi:type II secretory pathway pseudopilin PulG